MTPSAATPIELPPLTLPDGRVLTRCAAGDPDGTVALYLHGTGASRLEVALYGESAARHGIRLIAWDRPGSGGSTVQPGRTVRSVVADARAVAASVDADRPVVLGLSGGGTHALVLAATAPDVVRAAIAVNPGPPADDDTLALLPRSQAEIIRLVARWPRVFDVLGRFTESRSRLPTALKMRAVHPMDRKLIEDPSRKPLLEAAALEGARQPRSFTHDARVIWAQPWGVDLTTFPVPLHVFAGRNDAFAGFSQSLSAAGAQLHWFPGGHLSGFAEPVLDEMMSVIAAQ